MVIDNTQVYITGFLYNMLAFPDDPHVPFNIVNTKFGEITALKFEDLCINRSENRFSNSTTREQMIVFMKGVSYNGSTFLTDAQSTSLRADLIAKLNSVGSFSYDDVEIRTVREVI